MRTFVIMFMLFTNSMESHKYANLEEIRNIYRIIKQETPPEDLNDPIKCFMAMKKLLAHNLIDNLDILGTISGLVRIKNKVNNLSDISEEDLLLIENVKDFLQFIDWERETSIDYSLGSFDEKSTV